MALAFLAKEWEIKDRKGAESDRDQEKGVASDNFSPPEQHVVPATAAERDAERKAADAYYAALKREESKFALAAVQSKPLSPAEEKARRVRIDGCPTARFSQHLIRTLSYSAGRGGACGPCVS